MTLVYDTKARYNLAQKARQWIQAPSRPEHDAWARELDRVSQARRADAQDGGLTERQCGGAQRTGRRAGSQSKGMLQVMDALGAARHSGEPALETEFIGTQVVVA